uniref:RNA helicase n=1 Tax=Strigamia maritima TaxID=126957 RepID=T1IZC6_STRMM
MAERGRKMNSKGKANKLARSTHDKSTDGRLTKHPAGLKGKEIGLWYARKNRSKKTVEKPIQRNVVGMSDEMEWKLSAMLENIKSYSFTNPERASIQSTSKYSAGSSHSNSRETFLPSLSTFETRYLRHISDMGRESTSFQTVPWTPEHPDPIQNLELDKKLFEEFVLKKESKLYNGMQELRRKLPSNKSRDEIITAIESNPVVVISGETGCGKTTQVPQFILDHYISNKKGSLCSIICSQPRRISAITVAERVAQERAEICGDESVGYQIRLENKIPRNQGSILFCTTGIILKWLESDEYLHRASHIIIDEVHERDLLTDFLMIIIKKTLQKRPNLHVILMSASLNANRFSKYFGDCPVLNIPGFTFPVQQIFLEDALEMMNYRKHPDHAKKKGNWRNKQADVEQRQNMDVFLRNLSPEKYSRHNGAILVFLPGWDSISKLNNILMTLYYFRSNSSKHLIIPLHSLMPTINQRDVFNRPPAGVRKIILATNIAETSITIDDVVYVVDCGKIKLKRFDVEHNVATLQPEWVSQANAKQRRGRAGRVQPGVCFHLYTSMRHDLLETYQLPEILRTRLEELCLQVKLLKLGEIVPFLQEAMDPPSIDAVKLSLSFLQDLNALDSVENLTPLGFHLAHLPVDPQTGKMILFGAIFSCLDPITTIAASLSFKDAFVVPLGKEKEADEQRKKLAQNTKSDHLMLVNAYKGWETSKYHRNERKYCWENFLSINTLHMLTNMKKQFLMYLKDLHLVNTTDVKHRDLNLNSKNEKLLRAIICAGLYPNVASIKTPKRKLKANNSRRHETVKVTTKHEKTAYLHPKSVNDSERYFESPWIVYHQRMKSTCVYIHDSSMVSPYPLLLFGGKLRCGAIDRKYGVTIDGWIKFWCPEERADLIMRLRNELDKLLEHKILHPAPTMWDLNNKEGNLLHTIIDLINGEQILMMAGDELRTVRSQDDARASFDGYDDDNVDDDEDESDDDIP